MDALPSSSMKLPSNQQLCLGWRKKILCFLRYPCSPPRSVSCRGRLALMHCAHDDDDDDDGAQQSCAKTAVCTAQSSGHSWWLTGMCQAQKRGREFD
eukprot:2417067-Rhodomonas_salina.2